MIYNSCTDFSRIAQTNFSGGSPNVEESTIIVDCITVGCSVYDNKTSLLQETRLDSGTYDCTAKYRRLYKKRKKLKMNTHSKK